MTNEEKLKRLLEVAIENGWEDTENISIVFNSSHFIRSCEINTRSCLVVYEFAGHTGFSGIHQVSINDLVTNFEKSKTSFIEALCEANLQAFANYSFPLFPVPKLNSKDVTTNLMMYWISRPTSQRLEWLFDTFAHLLV